MQTDTKFPTTVNKRKLSNVHSLIQKHTTPHLSVPTLKIINHNL